MSFLKFMFDSDYEQRRDIEELREMQYKMALSAPSGGASEKWVAEIADEVKELAATVAVLMRKLAASGQLDIPALQAEVLEELRPKAKRARVEGPGHEVACMKCSTKGNSNTMVKVGADWMCRDCARNP